MGPKPGHSEWGRLSEAENSCSGCEGQAGVSWAEGLGDWSKGVPEAGKGAETGSCGEEHVLKVVQLGEPERAGRGDGRARSGTC